MPDFVLYRQGYGLLIIGHLLNRRHSGLIRTYASAHLSMGIQNFYRSESRLGREGRMIEQMAIGDPPVVRNGILQVPDNPGLGFTIDEAFLKKHLPKDEPWWG